MVTLHSGMRAGAASTSADGIRRQELDGRRRSDAAAAFGFLAPDGIGLLLFIIIPTAMALVVGLFSVDGFGNVEWAGLDNFRLMAGDGLLWRSFGITAAYAALFVPLAFFASLGLALLVKDHFRGVGAVRAALFLPNAVSLVVIGLLWQFLLTDKTGALAKLTGLDGVSWLGDPSLALVTLVLISVWFLMGYQMLIFLGGLQDIPREYYDAATVDGGGPWQRFRHVTWPMLRPTSFFVLVTSTINAITGMQVFDLVFVTTSGGPANATTTVVFYAYQQAFQFGRFGYAAAICALLVVALGAITAAMFALTRGGRFDD
ncbi:carbohydrate ABC transporter membrane protein 1, CUT1 family (TC 3.A.1.1.-) [Saccharopolyspora kobensis]|uniref:Carbohydrate ABC transporter membrane protein 1, CUT1 family n=2 Tax=Saccharopolyspora kobensis TaxID=146035 RepID=A0A1H6BZK9_9PSEU|nr:carbohydrate ABC transporter membrane protein 1, CUT1 family (TC 3.A.1.1.-) [Saccharopolyspora kobensis]SFC22169.1 carbohydrate ABC transporter membrane protein 1, CUT1 family [Saccharopolyspora kobensis]